MRQVLMIGDVLQFQRFLKLCAARVGNIVNYVDLARDCDISPNTAKEWLSVLEASFIVKLLPSYHGNFSKRAIKSPKLYFYDTALVCSLLGIKTSEELSFHPIKGALFESFVISELFKYNFNHNEQPALFFWRDAQGREIDCIIETSLHNVVPVEIKAGKTVQPDFFRGIAQWQDVTKQTETRGRVISGGDGLPASNVYAWYDVAEMARSIYERRGVK